MESLKNFLFKKYVKEPNKKKVRRHIFVTVCKTKYASKVCCF